MENPDTIIPIKLDKRKLPSKVLGQNKKAINAYLAALAIGEYDVDLTPSV